MHIKHIEISGFKSYKEASTPQPFSPQINVVVGANGSGKSNFFHAIRFVLNDSFINMRPEERQQLLHEGAGHAVPQAYVEIVFDNSDGRFPLDKDEVRLRRTIGKNKDEFQLDRKHINKGEVSNLLESAGFSRANPYYIVQQGKIMSMSAMKDNERLELLKEIGGTKVYEDRRKESLDLMTDTESRRRQIEDVMSTIDDKLKELDAERKELAEHQAADRDRRALEFALLDKQYTKTKQQLEQAESEGARLRAEMLSAGGGNSAQVIAELKDAARAAQEEAQAASRAVKTAKARRDELAKSRVTLEADVAFLQDEIKRARSMLDSSSHEAEALQQEIAATEEQLQEARDAVRTAQESRAAAQQRVDSGEARRRQLLNKQGATKQYKSVAERNAALDQQISTLDGVIHKETSRLESLTAQLAGLNEELMTRDQEMQGHESSAAELEAAVAPLQQQLKQLDAQRNSAMNERRDVWAKEQEEHNKVASLDAELKARQTAFEGTMARDIARASHSLERLVVDFGVQGVCGRLIDLIDCPPQLFRAVEVTAGNSLFHVVVDTDDVALRCTKLLQERKGGRITFMPLNKLNPPQVPQVAGFGSDVIPLVNKVAHNDKYRPAVQQVFGTTLLCKDMDVALEANKRAECNCVTIEGDQVGKFGSLTGGYHDERASRLACKEAVKVVAAQRDQAAAKAQEYQSQAAALDAQVHTLTQACQAKRLEVEALQRRVREARDCVKVAQRNRKAAQDRIPSLEAGVLAIQSKLPGLQTNLAGLRAEKASPLSTVLTPEEQEELRVLREVEIKEAQAALKQATTAVNKAEAKVAKLSSRLTDVLLPQEAEQQKQDVKDKLETQRQTLDDTQSRLATLEPELTSAEQRLKDAMAGSEAAAGRAAKAKEEVEVAVDQAAHREAKDAEMVRAVEEVAGRCAQLTASMEDLSRRIRELGALPADAIDKHRNRSAKELQRALAAANKTLAGLGRVNRQALDQYSSFTQQRQELLDRKNEMDVSERKIRELIDTLDARKNEAIERTFKGVAKHFREVFAELVPGGRGELVMQKRGPGGGGGDGDEDDVAAARDNNANNQHGALERYSGVKVRVAFTTGGETMSLKQLSGGQKTLVALALIFAIQRCDPAPFYLFDEIDAALDPQYRTTVARLLRKQATDARSPAQFIVTTFHPQIVGEADKLYGIAHSNRVSRVFVINQDDALKFLQAADDQQGPGEEQAAGGRQGGSSSEGGQQGAAGERVQQGAAEEPRRHGRGRRVGARHELLLMMKIVMIRWMWMNELRSEWDANVIAHESECIVAKATFGGMQVINLCASYR